MCIRDRDVQIEGRGDQVEENDGRDGRFRRRVHRGVDEGQVCLLYTSDAADERSSVDLGGRRIITKKKNVGLHSVRHHAKHKPNKGENVLRTET